MIEADDNFPVLSPLPNMSSSSLDVEHVLSNLTLDEKIALLSGKDTWGTHAVERLGIPSITVCHEVESTRNIELHIDFNTTDNRWTAWRAGHILFQWRESTALYLMSAFRIG